MNLTRVLQPYVCCLGNPVAGNPTQFVMYRAARACGVDWRFFTSQVELDQFEVAFRGVQALGLRGMALFDPFQAKAIDLLDSVTESAICLGGVNVARLDGNSWLGDNTLGIAIASCIEPLLEASPISQPGEGTTVHRPSAILVVGDSKLGKAIRLASPDLAHRIFVVPDVEKTQGDSAMHHEPWELPSLETFCEREFDIGCLVCDKLPPTSAARQFAALPWAKSPSCLVLANSSDKQMRSWNDALKVHSVMQIEPVELMTHQAVADFYFWTGVTPTVDLIRDSLEEYMQW
jgi:shikimate dehydrogenase